MQSFTRLLKIVPALLLLAAGIALPPDAALPSAAQRAESAWTWLNPRPQGNNISAVACSGSVCFAAGWFGTLLETRDHGATWTPLRSGTHADLSDISCPTPTTCAVLSAATLRLTHDAGAGWSHFTPPIADVLVHVTCPSSSACYALGFDSTKGCPVPNCHPSGPTYTMVVTTNGGRTWRSSHVGSAIDLGPLACGDPNRCIAIADRGAVYETTNAGRSWTHRSTICATLSVPLRIPAGRLILAGTSSSPMMAALPGRATPSRSTPIPATV